MESTETNTGQQFQFSLKLDITAGEEPVNEKVQDVFDCIKKDVWDLERHLQIVNNLNFVHISNVSITKEAKIHLTLTVQSSNELDDFYEVSKRVEKPKQNKLSACITQYAAGQGMQLRIGYAIETDLFFNITMPKKTYLLGIAALCADEGDSDDDNHEEIPPETIEKEKSVSLKKLSSNQTDCLTKKPKEDEKNVDHTRTTKKRFLVYVPSVEGKTLHHVNIVISCPDGTRKMPLEYIYENIYGIKMDFSVDSVKKIKYFYEAKYEGIKLMQRLFGRDEALCNSKSMCLKEVNIIRDKWPQHLAESTFGHLKHMVLTYSHEHSLADVCEEIDDLLIDPEQANRIAQKAFALINQVKKNDEKRIVAVVVAKLHNKINTFSGHVPTEVMLSQHMAERCLKALNSTSLMEFPKSWQSYMHSFCENLAVSTLEDNFCPLGHINLCYDFLGEDIILSYVNRCKSQKAEFSDDSNAMFEIACTFCKMLYRRHLDGREPKKGTNKMILEKVLRRVPFMIAVDICQLLVKNENITDVDPDERKLQDSIYASVAHQIIPILHLVKRFRKDVQVISAHWVLISKIKELHHNTTYKLQFEQAIIEVLGYTKINNTHNIGEVIKDLCTKYGFFESVEVQKELLSAISESTHIAVLKLIVQLSHVTQIQKGLETTELSVFKKWFTNYLKKLKTESEEHILRETVQMYADFMGIDSLSTRTDVKKAIEKEMYIFIEKQDLRDVLGKIHVFEKICENQPDVETVLNNTVQEMLKKKFSSYKPDTLLHKISGPGCKLQIKSDVTAKTVCILMDLYFGKGQGSVLDDFTQVLRYADFWNTIFQIEGKDIHFNTVRGNNSYVRVQECIDEVIRLFQSSDVTIDFIVHIRSDIQGAKRLLASRDMSNTGFVNMLRQLDKEFKDEKKKLTTILSVIKKIEEQPEIPDVSVLILEIKEIRGLIEKSKITAKQMHAKTGIWGNLEELPKLCENIESAVASKLFWNVCKQSIIDEFQRLPFTITSVQEAAVDVRYPYDNEIDAVPQHDEITRNKTGLKCINVEHAMEFLRLLNNVGISLYRKTWEMLNEIDDRPMSSFLTVIQDVNMPEEIDIAVKVTKIYLETDVRKALNRIGKRKTLLKNIAIIQSFLKTVSLYEHLDQDTLRQLELSNDVLKGDLSCYTFNQTDSVLKTLFAMTDMLSDDTLEIMDVTSRSSELLEFLYSSVEDEFRNLIDAVEDISEQEVNASTVSSLIEVKRFLHPLLAYLRGTEKNAIHFLEKVEKQTEALGTNARYIPSKVRECADKVNNLKTLYNNVANRGEQTKESITNIVTKSKVNFFLDIQNDKVHFEVTYSPKKKDEFTKDETGLTDLRSRALLLMNSEWSSVHGNLNKEELRLFVDTMDICASIKDILQNLHISGHMEFVHIKNTHQFRDLSKQKEYLLTTFSQWIYMLDRERDKYYLLNFLRGYEMQTLLHFLEGLATETAVDIILKYIHPHMKPERLRKEYKETDTTHSHLSRLGKALHLAHTGLSLHQRRLVFQQKDLQVGLTNRVHKGRLLVVKLEEDSVCVVQIVLTLFINTTNRLPEANQIVFCSSNTHWSDIQLLLRRCIESHAFYQEHALFCIANVELLPSHILFKLVGELQTLNARHDFLLAVTCRGTNYHPFIDELHQYVTVVQCLSYQTINTFLREHFLDVCTYVSDVAGQGKTTEIYRDARSNGKGKGVKTLHVSDPFDRKELLKQLQQIGIDEFYILHIDIYSTRQPVQVDIFLFELIVLQFICDGKIAVFMPHGHIAVEISNTINDRLRNSLHTVLMFERKSLRWDNFENFVVSRELNSSVQVVCQYLNLLQQGQLDIKDVCLNGENKVMPLPANKCQQLLRTFVNASYDMSFTVVNTFVNVLADQLKKLSCSTFFKVSRVLDMVSDSTVPTVRSSLVREMVQVSLEFASRCVSTCRHLQNETSADDQERNLSAKREFEPSLLSRMDGMIRWDESNHLIYVFHNQNVQTLSPMYRHVKKVPSQVKTLFENQMSNELQDFSTMNQKELQNFLQNVARTNPKTVSEEKLISPGNVYALTPDNLLKMVLIVMRIKSKVPVILMGETGCGKTSLIRYLGTTCNVKMHVVNIHPGIETDTIISVTLNICKLCSENLNCEQWLFFDEINTSEHLGLICDILCHHRCTGVPLPPNLIAMGACNPYQLRSKDAIFTAGLDSKLKSDEMSKLVYRVHPLPETMVDYVWDFGSLTEKDEQKYVETMLAGVFQNKLMHRLFCDLVCASQAFVRCKESAVYVVSLRDVFRCKLLVSWFLSAYLSTGDRKREGTFKYPDRSIVAMILTLEHCYHCRFFEKKTRLNYRRRLSEVFLEHRRKSLSEQYIHDIIKREQKILIDRMELPPGTAKNTALQENVFVLLVCILNKIPVFVVGKPGCSKSMAMQVIRSSVRGRDSKDSFLKTLPQLLCVSFQGSESSTSDGIIKVFEKAEAYQKANNQDVLSVVLLDEIGLAEISPFNPLKVLHSLLEPTGFGIPNISVVGISNWALDAAKMNRAIYLSRPDLDQEELYDTAKSISESFIGAENNEDFTENAENYCLTTNYIEKDLLNIARSYAEYSKNLRFENFHGLRDFYALVKYVAQRFLKISKEKYNTEKVNVLQKGLDRNFGGLQAERGFLYKCFSSCLCKHIEQPCSVIDLIAENVSDSLARHLMIIMQGDSVVSVVEHLLKNVGSRRLEQLVGSKFDEDQSDAYNYRILSKIILCMEQGIILILKDLECIYGSMYDMLNQNYITIGKKKNCRIALGAYSNPFCEVTDSFRCIVLVDGNQVDYSDPPFLNRFEKQHLSYVDVLTPTQSNSVKRVKSWVQELSEIEGKPFLPKDAFPNYNEELIVSLILSVCQKESQDTERIFEKCKRRLMWIIRPEAVMRLSCCSSQTIRGQYESILSEYLDLPLHAGIYNLIKHQTERLIKKRQCRKLTVVFTNSNIHAKEIQEISNCKSQFERLGAFKSEKELSARIQHFWSEPNMSLLFVHCSSQTDLKHISLTMSVIEKFMLEFENSKMTNAPKLVYLLLHLERSVMSSSSFTSSHMNYLSGWKLVTLDCLDIQNLPLPVICRKSVLETIHLTRPLHQYISRELFWSFSKIQYSTYGRNIRSIERVLNKMKSKEFLSVFEERLWTEIKHRQDEFQVENWQEMIACDEHTLYTSQSFTSALEKYGLNIVQKSLEQLIYKLEDLGAVESFFKEDQHTIFRKSLWKSLFQDRMICPVESVQTNCGPESYRCNTPDLSLECPFSRLIYETIEYARDDFMCDLKTVKFKVNCMDEYGELYDDIFQQLVRQQVDRLSHILPTLPFEDFDTFTDSYLNDFCNMTSYTFHLTCQNDVRVASLKWVMVQKTNLKSNFPSERLVGIHASYWTNESLIKAVLCLNERCLEVFPDETFRDDSRHKHAENSHLSAKEDRFEVQSDMMFEEAPDAKLNPSHSHAETDFTFMERTRISKSEESLNQQFFPVNCELRCDSNSIIYSPNVGTYVSKTMLLSGNGNRCIDEPEENTTSQSSDVIHRRILSDLGKSQNTLSLEEYVFGVSDPLEKFVSYICYKCLPTSEILTKFGGVSSWQNKIRNILTLAAEVSKMPPLLHALQFCDDVADFVIIPLSLNDTYLSRIATCIEHNQLDSDDVFKSFMVVVEKALQKKEEKQIQVALSQYLFRCFYFDPCTVPYERVFNLILESRLPEKCVELLKSPLCLILQHEVEDGVDIAKTLLFFSGDAENKTDLQFNGIQGNFLRYLHSFLKSLEDMSLRCHTIVILIVDLLQDIFFEKETCKSGNEFLLKSGEIIRNGSFGLPFISAVAFFKASLNMFGATYDNNLSTCETSILININAVLKGIKGSGVYETMVVYVLKTLGKNSKLRSLMQKCQSLQGKVSIFKEVSWTENYLQNSLAENPLSVFVPEHTQKATKLIDAQNESTFKSQMDTLATLAQQSGCSTLLLYSLSARTFYFPRYFQTQTDTTISFGNLFLEKHLPKMDSSRQQTFLKCIIGKEDFRCRELMPTDNQTIEHYFINTVLVTIYALGLTYSEFNENHTPLLPKCLLSTSEVSSCFLPGFPDNADAYTINRNFQKSHNVKFTTCRCGHRMAFHIQMREYRCVNCNEVVTGKLEEPSFESNMKAIEPCSGYVRCTHMTDMHWSVRSLSSVSCNVLYLLIKGSVYGSLALGINTPDDIRTYLKLPGNVEQIWDEIIKHWINLKQMLNIGDYHLSVLFQAIISECRDFLFSERIPFATVTDRKTWEASFEDKMKNIVTGKFKIIATQIRKCDDLFQLQPAFLEQRLLEADDLSDQETLNETMPVFFRMTNSPSKHDFITQLQMEANSFHFLKFVIQKENKLALPIHIFNIIQWHLSTISTISFTMRSDEYAALSVQDIFGRIKDENKKQMLKKRFQKFRETWANLKEQFDSLDEMPEIEHVNIKSSLSKCLLLGESSQTSLVLSTLMEIQNDFIDTALLLAQQSDNLYFLSKRSDCFSVKCVPVTDIRPDQLIQMNFEWLEEVLKHESQCCLTYGEGQHVKYELDRIEREFSIRLLLEKCYLNMEVFPKIIFIDEIYKNFGVLVKEIRLSVKQEPLPDEVLTSFTRKCKDDISLPIELINYIDMIMSMLKGMRCEPKQSLIDFIAERKHILGRALPERYLPSPERAVQLCHIVSLHEALEEICADNTLDGLETDFCQLLDSKSYEVLKKVTAANRQHASRILKATKLFVYRCLSMRAAHPDQDLVNFLADDSFWPEGYIVDGVFQGDEIYETVFDLFPNRILVCHAGAIIHCLTENMDEVTGSTTSRIYSVLGDNIRPHGLIDKNERRRRVISKLHSRRY